MADMLKPLLLVHMLHIVIHLSCGLVANDSMPGLHLAFCSNKSKELQPSESVKIDFEMMASDISLGLQNLLLVIEVQYPMAILSSASNQYENRSESIILNKTSSLDVSYASLLQRAIVSVVLKTSKSLESQAKVFVKYKIQYVFKAVRREFSFTKILYTKSVTPYLQQSIAVNPTAVEGEDLVTIAMVITNNNATVGAYNVTSQINMTNAIILNVNCSDENTTYFVIKNGTTSMKLGNLGAQHSIYCRIRLTVGNNLELGGKLIIHSMLSYYNREPHDTLYPIEETAVQYINVSSVIMAANSSSNLSRLQAGDIFKLSLTFSIPQSTSVIDVIVRFPTYKMVILGSSGNNSKQNQYYPVVTVSLMNISHSFGSAIENGSVPEMKMANDSILNINYGVIKSIGSNTGNTVASAIILQLLLEVANDSLNVFGIKDNIVVTTGHSHMHLPFVITGPVFYPVLSFQKSVKILDASRDSPLLSFTILIRHSNTSNVDASDLKIVDLTENMVIYTYEVIPNGKIEVSPSSSYVTTINIAIDRLRVSDSATVTYTGAFLKGVQSSYFKRKAIASWRSVQVNNARVITGESEEICLSSTKKTVVQYQKSYTMVLLGVVAGVIFGVLLGLLIIFCLRKFKVAKAYVFTDIMEEKHVVAEAENQNVNGDQSNLILLDTHKMYQTGHQVNPEQKTEYQKLDRRSWALMVAAKYGRTSAEISCSRNLIEMLVHGYDSSFHYFVDSLSQAINIFARSLRSNGDLSAENLQKIQSGMIQINSKFNQDNETLKNQIISMTDDLQEAGRKYLEGQCSLVQATKDSCSDLFHSMFHAPSKIEKERARELKNDFADLERVAFVNANSLRAHAFLHVKQNQITLNGYVNVLVWSQKIFYLWCQWMSKKLRRELDILQRRRSITDSDIKTLSSNIDYIFKQEEVSYEQELHRKAMALEKESYFDFWTFFKTLDVELKEQLKALNIQPHQGSSRLHKDTLDVIKKRYDLFANKIKVFLEKHEQHQSEMFTRTLSLIGGVATQHLKDTTGNIELLVMKYFSQNPPTKMREQNSLENDSSSQDVENSSKKETMKVILECLEDVQADFGEAQNTNDAIVEDFIEEIQSAREDIQQMLSGILQETDKLIDEPIVQCRFQFKSLLYFLRDLSLPKIKSILENWSMHLHLTLTDVYMRKDLKNWSEIASKKVDDSEKENVIYWFKPIDSITNSEFQETKRGFADFVQRQTKELRELFQDQTECLRDIAKDYVYMDLKEDSAHIREISSLKQEFLIVHQYVTSLLDELDDNQKLAHPEVKDCFNKFDKAVRLLLAKDKESDEPSEKMLQEDINGLMSDFKKQCESMQAEPNLGACGKTVELLYDEHGIIEKIERMIKSKQNQQDKINTLRKLQNENLCLLGNLRKIDQIEYSKFMELIRVLHSNLSKSRFDEILLSIEGNSQRDFAKELNSYLANEERPKEREDNEQKALLQPRKTNKKRRKNKMTKKNAIQPEP